MGAAASWLCPTPLGLYCAPGGFHIDPVRPVDKAVITHGHGDHARAGHQAVLATSETVEIMKTRFGAEAAGTFDAVGYGESRDINGVRLRLAPAGHILGSAQAVLEHDGTRIVVSGDYKRSLDPTCAPFEVVPCDLFVTEATFALPVFRHEPAHAEVARLLDSLRRQPDRAHLVGVYGLGKCQRLLKLLQLAGYDRPVYLHTSLVALTRLYEQLGQRFGAWQPVMETSGVDFAGALVLCPPSALADRWSRRFGDAVTAFASGWMRVRGRARQRGVELPLVVSDHADWPELLATIEDSRAGEVWVTHGREDALVHEVSKSGRKVRALSLVGFEDEAE